MLLAVISSFVLAELGDKTMLATVTLASDHHWAGVWIGATAGMVLADGVAIAVGAVMHKRLPEHFLHVMASVLFLLFGLWLLFDGALGWRWVALAVDGFGRRCGRGRGRGGSCQETASPAVGVGAPRIVAGIGPPLATAGIAVALSSAVRRQPASRAERTLVATRRHHRECSSSKLLIPLGSQRSPLP